MVSAASSAHRAVSPSLHRSTVIRQTEKESRGRGRDIALRFSVAVPRHLFVAALGRSKGLTQSCRLGRLALAAGLRLLMPTSTGCIWMLKVPCRTSADSDNMGIRGRHIRYSAEQRQSLLITLSTRFLILLSPSSAPAPLARSRPPRTKAKPEVQRCVRSYIMELDPRLIVHSSTPV